MFKNLKEYNKRMVFDPTISKLFMKKSIENSRVLSNNLHIANNKMVSKRNTNVFVESNDVSFNTDNILIPNLLQENGSYLIFDKNVIVKYTACAKKMVEDGYRVVIADFSHYDPFRHCSGPFEISEMAAVFARKIEYDYEIDHFEYLKYLRFYEAVLGCVYESYPDDKKNLCSVSDIVLNKNVINDLQEWYENSNNNSFKSAYEVIKNLTAAEMEIIYENCRSDMTSFYKDINYYPDDDDLNFMELFVKNTVYIFELNDRSTAVLGQILYLQISKIFTSLAQSPSNFNHLDFYVNGFGYISLWFNEIEIHIIQRENRFNCILCADKYDLDEFNPYAERFLSSCDNVISYNYPSDIFTGSEEKYLLTENGEFIKTDQVDKKCKAFVLTRGLPVIIDDVFRKNED